MTDEEFKRLSAKVNRLEKERKKEKDRLEKEKEQEKERKLKELKNRIKELEQENTFYKALVDWNNINRISAPIPNYSAKDYTNYFKSFYV